MQRPMSRRKYSALVKFLRSVLTHPKATLPQKLRAAERLDAIYERHELAELRREERESKSSEATATAPAPESQPEPEPAHDPDAALREAQEFLNRLKAKDAATV